MLREMDLQRDITTNTASQSEEDEEQSSLRHLIITVHGIRTFGQWQERLETLVQSCDPGIKVRNYHFGYYSILAYLFPPLRWLMTLRFRRALIKETGQTHWDRIDIVAHSFGTHLAAWGLYGIPSDKRPKIHTIIFAASVLKQNFSWSELLSTCVGRLVNECGERDDVLLFNQFAVLFSGRAGQAGFNGMTSDGFRNRFFNFGHSGYFMKGGKIYDDFMQDKWVPLLTRDEPQELFDERTLPSEIRGFLIFLANNATPLKLTLYTIMLVVPTFWINGLYKDAKEQRAIAEGRLLSFLANSFLTDRLDLALLLSVEANRTPTLESRSALLTSIKRSERLLGMLHTPGLRGTAESVAFSPDGKLLVSGSADGTIQLWDVARRVPLGDPLRGHDGKVRSVGFSPDGKILASGNIDGTIQLWDVARRVPIGKPLTGQRRGVTRLAFSPDGSILASAGLDPVIMLWDVARRMPLGEPLTGHRSAVTGLAFSPDGSMFASASADRTIRLWDVSRRAPAGEPLAARGGAAFGLAFSPDASILASATLDRTVVLWDVARREPIGEPLSGHSATVWSVAFSPDGKLLASGDIGGTILLWPASVDSWKQRACQIANRNLTQEEWTRYMRKEEPRETCSMH
jgi:hypothetical protein